MKTITLSLLLCSTAFGQSLIQSGVIQSGVIGGTQQIIPSISVQPVAQTALTNTSQTLSVTASGSPTLQYQWYLASGAVAGATTSSYATNSTVAETNSYSVIVSNSFGTATSSSAALAWTNGSTAGIAFVHDNSSGCFAGGDVSVFTNLTTTSGNAIVVALSWYRTDPTSCTNVSDTHGNTYVAGPPCWQGGMNSQIFYALNATGGSNGVTAKFNSTVTFRDMYLAEWSGMAASAALDGSSTNQTTITSTPFVCTAGTITTTGNGDLIISAFNGNGGTFNSPSNWTNPLNDCAYVQYIIQPAAGSISVLVTNTAGSGGDYSSVAIALKHQ